MHVTTPLVPSAPLSAVFGGPVWLKLENLQPTGSFKLRGVGLACTRAAADGAKRLVSSSGGNAGLAVAWAGRELGLPVTVVVPSTTSERTIARLRAHRAEVVVHGAAWDDAHAHALALARAPGAVIIHPFDHPDLWEGHSSLIVECAEAMDPPGAVVVAVGGGGLLAGIVHGMRRVGWGRVPVIAAETAGAASYAAALAAGRPVTLDRIDTTALSLGARRVCERAVECATTHEVRSVVCTDAEAWAACRWFADEHRMLVEPACGAALAAPLAPARLAALAGVDSLLVVVCGGAGVTLSSFG